MPDPHSPYVQSAADQPRPGGSGNQTVMIVAIVSFTLLLMCAGVLGLGYFAVNRFIEEMAGLNGGGFYEDDETTVALEYVLADNDQLTEQIGEFQSVQYDEAKNLESSDESGLHYTATGSQGTASLFVELSSEEKKWFDNVSILPSDPAAGSPVVLQLRSIPFDSAMSKTVVEAINSSESAKATFGEVTMVSEDWDLTDELTDDDSSDYIFRISSTTGEHLAEASFDDFDFEKVATVTLLNEDKTRGEVVYKKP